MPQVHPLYPEITDHLIEDDVEPVAVSARPWAAHVRNAALDCLRDLRLSEQDNGWIADELAAAIERLEQALAEKP